MTSEMPDVQALITRVNAAGRSVEFWRAGAVFRLAREMGVRFEWDGEALDFIGPRAACLYLASSIRRHKLALSRGACGRCSHDLAEPNGFCRWCGPVMGRHVAYEPNSDAERQFLNAMQVRLPKELNRAA